MNYEQVVSEHLRITILRMLEDNPSRRMNESLIVDAVEPYGFLPSRDRIRTELSWLQEQGFIILNGSDCFVASLTRRGEDIAKGRAVVPGVKRPSGAK